MKNGPLAIPAAENETPHMNEKIMISVLLDVCTNANDAMARRRHATVNTLFIETFDIRIAIGMAKKAAPACRDAIACPTSPSANPIAFIYRLNMVRKI